MRVRILGCGGASGVPAIGAGWGACDPAEPRNRRLRPSILVSEGETRILVDTSPDLRVQLLEAGVRRLDAVLYTHDHADHLHGIDDLREINRVMGGPLDIWAAPEVLDTIARRFAYVLPPLEPDSPSIYRPLLVPRPIDGPFSVQSIPVTPFDQDHGNARTLGFRIGNFAYSTDVVALDDTAFSALAGVESWVIGCLVDFEHPTHAHVDKALEWIERIRPRRAYLTHMGPRLDYARLKATLPPGVEPAYDGLEIVI